jgi:hypothetical protein
MVNQCKGNLNTCVDVSRRCNDELLFHGLSDDFSVLVLNKGEIAAGETSLEGLVHIHRVPITTCACG